MGCLWLFSAVHKILQKNSKFFVQNVYFLNEKSDGTNWRSLNISVMFYFSDWQFGWIWSQRFYSGSSSWSSSLFGYTQWRDKYQTSTSHFSCQPLLPWHHFRWDCSSDWYRLTLLGSADLWGSKQETVEMKLRKTWIITRKMVLCCSMIKMQIKQSRIKGTSGGPRHCIWTPDCPLKLSSDVAVDPIKGIHIVKDR